jgi:ASC-1-like (ASCH) protein
MPQYLELIRSGQKTVEGRIRAGHWADAAPGDVFVLCSNQDSNVVVEVEVTSVRYYESFQGMLEGEGVSACLPGVASVAEGVDIYQSIPGYSEREAPNGVVALCIRLIPTMQMHSATR